MSLSVPKTFLTRDHIKQIDRVLLVSPEGKKKFGMHQKFNISPPKVPFFQVFGNNLHVPLSWGLSYFGNSFRRETKEYKETDLKFMGKLREHQEETHHDAIRKLKENGSCLIAVYPGWGKTITALSIIPELQTTTLIIVNKLVLVEQWQEAIRKVLQLEPFVIKGKNCKIKPSPIYIVNAINLPKHDKETIDDLKIGMVIVDECHLILTKVFSQSLFGICPRYLLGLSATPFRADGFDVLFDLYFGIYRIHKSLYKPHKVFCIPSKIEIEHEIGKNGSINWNSVIEKQSSNEKRREIICKYITKYKEKNILVLCKRIKQMLEIQEELKKYGENSVSVFKESDVIYDKDARVLVSSFQKVGTGFSHEKLDMLILGSDTEEYFLQYLGRVFRRQDCYPIIIDIVDEHPILWKHYRTRAKIYRECGGEIKKIKNIIE